MTSFVASASLTGFPSTLSLPSTTSLNFTDADLAHALFVTGRAPGDITRHGLTSYWEFLHRASLIPAYVRTTAAGRLIRSPLALELDRSEKVNLSYSLGQALATIFCERVLGVTRLLHVDRYAHHHGVVFGTGRKRPDLFGLGSGGWVVIEAKGRSNAMESGLAQTLKDQKSIVASISGMPPWVAMGCVTEFPRPDGVMRVQAIDPRGRVMEAEEWRVTRDRFFAAYYAPFMRALEVGTPIPDRVLDESDARSVRAVDLGPLGIRLGLLESIVETSQAIRRRGPEGFADAVDEILSDRAASDLRADGSFVETSWSDAITRRDGGNAAS